MTSNCILERVAETQSTNDDLLARWRAGELIDPVARLAHMQTAGKGRAGRTWVAKPGNSISFSLAYPFSRTPAQMSGLSLVVGLATIDGIANALNMDVLDLHRLGVRLKWPNDLLIHSGKLGGILIEGGQANASDSTWMIIGVGLNLRNATAIEADIGSSNQLKVSAIDQLLSDTSNLPDMEYIWLKLIESLEQALAIFNEHGFTSYQQQWIHWDAYLGKAVSISSFGKETINGIAHGIDSNGALLIQQSDQTRAIHAGDLSLRMQS